MKKNEVTRVQRFERYMDTHGDLVVIKRERRGTWGNLRKFRTYIVHPQSPSMRRLLQVTGQAFPYYPATRIETYWSEALQRRVTVPAE